MRRNRIYCLGINDYNSKVFALYCWSSEKKTTQTRTIIFCMKWIFFVCVSFDLFLIRKCKMLYLHMYINNSSSQFGLLRPMSMYSNLLAIKETDFRKCDTMNLRLCPIDACYRHDICISIVKEQTKNKQARKKMRSKKIKHSQSE